jgi:excisionase family DNA binding protein
MDAMRSTHPLERASVETLLSVTEAAQVLRVSVHTLYGWTAEGRVPHVKLGRRTLFRPKELERWVVDRSVQEATQGEGCE